MNHSQLLGVSIIFNRSGVSSDKFSCPFVSQRLMCVSFTCLDKGQLDKPDFLLGQLSLPAPPLFLNTALLRKQYFPHVNIFLLTPRPNSGFRRFNPCRRTGYFSNPPFFPLLFAGSGKQRQ
ncbi:MAG: hypothetical protein U1C55_08010 [Smithellaceae bacterium]|nr:hypothetical protein [Smithellaceae bacterium]